MSQFVSSRQPLPPVARYRYSRTSRSLEMFSTSTSADAASASDAAVTVVEPGRTAVTNPLGSTEATNASSLPHVTAAPGIACPLASATTAMRVAVSPTAPNVSESGTRESVAAAWQNNAVRQLPSALFHCPALAGRPGRTGPAASVAGAGPHTL